MKAGTVAATVLPWAPVSRVDVEHFAAGGIDPAIGKALAGENQGMDAVIVDDGEFYILFERSFEEQPPHNRTLPEDPPASAGHEIPALICRHVFGSRAARIARDYWPMPGAGTEPMSCARLFLAALLGVHRRQHCRRRRHRDDRDVFYLSTSSNGSSSLRLTIVEERDGGIEPDQWRQRPTPGEGRKRLRPKNNRGYAILHGLAVSGWYPQVAA
ncbi:hypothetical protein RHECNPAF_470054 [Rhizobium etli CNPAF512]|nr:hypothetical protein RHECNPAF_470054 [Rhizobium etli CNPAF512]